MAKRRSSGKKRTISPEQQQKMQEGRKAAVAHRRKMSQLHVSGIAMTEERTRTQRMLDGVRRK